MPLTTCIIEYVRKDMKGKVLQKIFPALGTVNTITLYDSFAPLIGESAMELNARWQQASVFWVRKTICGVYG